jgi:hypothetical protein
VVIAPKAEKFRSNISRDCRAPQKLITGVPFPSLSVYCRVLGILYPEPEILTRLSQVYSKSLPERRRVDEQIIFTGRRDEKMDEKE